MEFVDLLCNVFFLKIGFEQSPSDELVNVVQSCLFLGLIQTIDAFFFF